MQRRPLAPVAATALAAVIVGLPPVAVAGSQPAPRAAQAGAIWERARAAIRADGPAGRPRALDIYARQFTPTSPPAGLDLEIHVEPTAFRWREQRARGDTLEFVTTRTQTRRLRPNGASEMVTDLGHRTLLRRWAEYSIAYLAAFPDGCEFHLLYVSRRLRDGAEAEGIDVAGPCTGRLRLWFDATTFRLRTIESQAVVMSASMPAASSDPAAVTPPQEVSQVKDSTLDARDFRRVDGFMLPHRLGRTGPAIAEAVEVVRVVVQQ